MTQVFESRFAGQPGRMHLRDHGTECEEDVMGRGSLLELVADH